MVRPLWRVVWTGAHSGAVNMAIDEAIADAVARRVVVPTLRFYQWQNRCLSLGVSQSAESIDHERLAQYGWDIVRRTTGGRAVLHDSDLSYSLSIPDDDPRMAGGVLPSYERIAQGFKYALMQLGLSADPPQIQPKHSLLTPACFEATSHYEITVNGQKLIGSAQKRQRNVVLQHGSILLSGDVGTVAELFAQTPQERALSGLRLRQQVTTLEQLLSQSISAEQVAQAVAWGLAEALQLRWQSAELTPDELEYAQLAAQAKYANPAWTLKKRMSEN